MSEVTKISETDSRIVAILLAEMKKAEDAVREYVRHAIGKTGADPDKNALSQDLSTVFPVEPQKPLAAGPAGQPVDATPLTNPAG